MSSITSNVNSIDKTVLATDSTRTSSELPTQSSTTVTTTTPTSNTTSTTSSNNTVRSDHRGLEEHTSANDVTISNSSKNNETIQLQQQALISGHDQNQNTTTGIIMLPNGQVMNSKTTLQSFDNNNYNSTPSIVLDVAATTNTTNSDARIQATETKLDRNINVKDQNSGISSITFPNQGVNDSTVTTTVDGIIGQQQQQGTNSNGNENLVTAYTVQSVIMADIVVPVESEQVSCVSRNRIYWILIPFIIVVCGVAIGVGTYCGLGNCAPTVEITPTTETTPTSSPSSLSSVGTMNGVQLSKETVITEYINNVTLSNQTLTINGTTAEDKALSWIVYHDPIFISSDIWSTLTSKSTMTNATIINTKPINAAQIRLRQRYALLTLWFQQELHGKWRNVTGWLVDENECNWYGINCTLIEMGGLIGGQRIVYVIDFYADEDKDDFDIINNNSTNTTTSAFVSSSFDIKDNHASGTLPIDLGLLTNMHRFDVFNNQFFGTIPEVYFASWKLSGFNVGNNHLTGTIPQSIGVSHLLRNINLVNNHFTGTIPSSIGNCTLLERFNIGHNAFNGTLPTTLGRWSFLENFEIINNTITGTLPHEIGMWKLITGFYVYNNIFTGTIPNTIGEWTMIEELNVEYNNLTGTIPNNISYGQQWQSIKRFDVSDNQLTGEIPEDIVQCTTLVYFSIEDNQFFGTIPEDIGMLTALTGLFLFNNQLTGEIPNSMEQLTKLRLLHLENNMLSGTIPSFIGNYSKLMNAQFQNNSFTGTVPASICDSNAIDSTPIVTVDCDLIESCSCCTCSV